MNMHICVCLKFSALEIFTAVEVLGTSGETGI